jgi:uncharacterized protein
MSLSLSQILVPSLVSTLTNMRDWLDRADVRANAALLLDARLAPDMFPFTRQYQIASDTAKSSVARLAGLEAPAMPDTEASMDELQQRLDTTLAYVASVDTAAIDAGQGREIEIKFPNGGGLRFDGETYATGFVLPNLYFHAMSAYALLRANGIAIGKFDFIAQMKPFMFAPPA